ncbi:aldo/keto reductase [Streptomyces sp. NPDC087300]|uniref:aldo/keto reductase n=1 Tax=Streptomyces sp. NPDC087300 TaxID=3365780 RepID=UPI00381A7D8F
MSGTPPAGTITLAGKTVSRLGLGTMRLTGPGTWGDPPDRAQALDVLRQAVHTHGITHIDTAHAYGPHTVERLIKDALHPYPEDLLIATKVGLEAWPAPYKWTPNGDPAYLRNSVEGSLCRLGVERLELCYLHRIDPRFPLAEQVGTLKSLQSEGKIGHIGLSKVSTADYQEASKDVAVAAVQNVLNIHDRYDPVQELCRDEGIPYVPYRPLDAGSAARDGALATALAWLLQLGPHIAPIPGTSNPQHLADIVRAATDGGAP